jgi:hypothetical protein
MIGRLSNSKPERNKFYFYLYVQWNPHLKISLGCSGLKKILNSGNLTLSLFTWNHLNWMLKEVKVKRGQSCPCAYAPVHENVNGGITPHILNLSTGWRWLDCFVPWLLYPQSLVGPQSWFGHCGEKHILFPLSGIKPWLPSHLSCSLVTTIRKNLKSRHIK